jgi:hypothetical protein
MSNSFPSVHDPLTEATQLVKNGRLDQAKEVLTRYLMKNPSSEQGWLLMSFVLSNAVQQKDCLERVLKINPNNTVAQSRLAHLLGKRTEELFQGKVQPPPAPPSPPSKTEPPAPKIKVPPAMTEPPVPEANIDRSQPAVAQFPPSIPLDAAALQTKKSPFSGKWFLIVTIVLIVIILGIVGILLYVGVIGPAISHLSITPTPTAQAVIVPSLPPAWTNTLTPTETPTPEFTATPTVTPTPPPTEVPTNTQPAGNKL